MNRKNSTIGKIKLVVGALGIALEKISADDLIKAVEIIESDDLFADGLSPSNNSIFETTHLEVGRCYFIRTATYHAVGRLVRILPTEFVFEEASWVADSGRWNNALVKGDLNEVEPFPDQLVVFRGGCIDATEWKHPLPVKVK